MIEVVTDDTGSLTVPAEMLRALNVASGGLVSVRIAGNAIVLCRANEEPAILNSPFAMFTEWADEADSAFDRL